MARPKRFTAEEQKIRNRESWRKSKARRRAENPELFNKKQTEWRVANPERNRAIQAKWRDTNPELARKCSREGSAKWRAANPERAKEQNKKALIKYRAANFERLRESNKKYVAKRRAANPEISRKALLRRHGLSIAEYNAMVISQQNTCGICTTAHPGRKNSGNWYVDHCHKTGKIRKLLCHRCNLGLGHFKDDVAVLQNAIDYLKSFR